MEAAKRAVRLWQAMTRHCPDLLTVPLDEGPGGFRADIACLNSLSAAPAPTSPEDLETRNQIVSLLARWWKENGPL